MTKKRGLGRGLSDLGLNELLSSVHTQNNELPSIKENPVVSGMNLIKITQIQPGRYQPRRDFDPQGLEELAESIRSQGIIQPIIVRQVAAENFEIIAGERRWRAAQIAGLIDVPVVIRDISDEAAVAIGLIENIQRQNLNAIEEAIALQRLNEEFSLTHQEIAKIVGKSRTTITNLLRLLALNSDVKELVVKGDLEMGHARALLALEGTQQSQAALVIVEKKLSVRDTEEYIKKIQNMSHFHLDSQKKRKNPETLRLEKDLSKRLGARVLIKHEEEGRGKFIIHFKNPDQMKDLLEYLA